MVEGVEVAAGVFEGLDPAFGLPRSMDGQLRWEEGEVGWGEHLGDHHVAVEGPFPVGGLGAGDVWPDLRYDGRAEGDVGHEVAVHDVDVEPGVGVSMSIATAGNGFLGGWRH